MPRTEEQFEALREKSRARIMAAALALFAEHGYHATPVTAIARKAGVAAGLLYNYFESKADLLRAIIARTQAEFGATVRAALEESGDADVGEFMDRLLVSMKPRLGALRVLLSVSLQASAGKALKGARAGFDRQLLEASRRLGGNSPGSSQHSIRERAELLHSVLIVYIATGDEALSRRLARAAFGRN